MKIATVVGTRPQLVKLLPFSRELRKTFSEVVIHTGQHYDDGMSRVFFRELELPAPDYELGVGSHSHAVQTGLMLQRVEAVLEQVAPACVVIFGDSNSTLAAALAAAKMEIRLVHVEAGLRSFDRSMPEEVNRVVADCCSDHLFAPTPTAMENLEREGLAAGAVLTGDIMVDSLAWIRGLSRAPESCLDRLGVGDRRYDLLTLHRCANVDDPRRLQAVLDCLRGWPRAVVFPVHPRTRAMLQAGRVSLPAEVVATDPLGPIDFVGVEERATKIITDSGGVQKEAYLLGVPCIVLRRETEWVELVDAGWSILAEPGRRDLAGVVESFEPSGARPPLLGRAVARHMVARIHEIIAT